MRRCRHPGNSTGGAGEGGQALESQQWLAFGVPVDFAFSYGPLDPPGGGHGDDGGGRPWHLYHQVQDVATAAVETYSAMRGGLEELRRKSHDLALEEERLERMTLELTRVHFRLDQLESRMRRERHSLTLRRQQVQQLAELNEESRRRLQLESKMASLQSQPETEVTVTSQQACKQVLAVLAQKNEMEEELVRLSAWLAEFLEKVNALDEEVAAIEDLLAEMTEKDDSCIESVNAEVKAEELKVATWQSTPPFLSDENFLSHLQAVVDGTSNLNQHQHSVSYRMKKFEEREALLQELQQEAAELTKVNSAIKDRLRGATFGGNAIQKVGDWPPILDINAHALVRRQGEYSKVRDFQKQDATEDETARTTATEDEEHSDHHRQADGQSIRSTQTPPCKQHKMLRQLGSLYTSLSQQDLELLAKCLAYDEDYYTETAERTRTADLISEASRTPHEYTRVASGGLSIQSPAGSPAHKGVACVDGHAPFKETTLSPVTPLQHCTSSSPQADRPSQEWEVTESDESEDEDREIALLWASVHGSKRRSGGCDSSEDFSGNDLPESSVDLDDVMLTFTWNDKSEHACRRKPEDHGTKNAEPAHLKNTDDMNRCERPSLTQNKQPEKTETNVTPNVPMESHNDDKKDVLTEEHGGNDDHDDDGDDGSSSHNSLRWSSSDVSFSLDEDDDSDESDELTFDRGPSAGYRRGFTVSPEWLASFDDPAPEMVRPKMGVSSLSQDSSRQSTPDSSCGKYESASSSSVGSTRKRPKMGVSSLTPPPGKMTPPLARTTPLSFRATPPPVRATPPPSHYPTPPTTPVPSPMPPEICDLLPEGPAEPSGKKDYLRTYMVPDQPLLDVQASRRRHARLRHLSLNKELTPFQSTTTSFGSNLEVVFESDSSPPSSPRLQRTSSLRESAKDSCADFSSLQNLVASAAAQKKKNFAALMRMTSPDTSSHEVDCHPFNRQIRNFSSLEGLLSSNFREVSPSFISLMSATSPTPPRVEETVEQDFRERNILPKTKRPKERCSGPQPSDGGGGQPEEVSSSPDLEEEERTPRTEGDGHWNPVTSDSSEDATSESELSSASAHSEETCSMAPPARSNDACHPEPETTKNLTHDVNSQQQSKGYKQPEPRTEGPETPFVSPSFIRYRQTDVTEGEKGLEATTDVIPAASEVSARVGAATSEPDDVKFEEEERRDLSPDSAEAFSKLSRQMDALTLQAEAAGSGKE